MTAVVIDGDRSSGKTVAAAAAGIADEVVRVIIGQQRPKFSNVVVNKNNRLISTVADVNGST